MSVPPAPNSQPMSATSSASGSSSRPRNSHRNSSYGSQTGSSSQSASSSLRNTAAYKRQNSINTIESSVTKLLVATKKLLECLKQWAAGDCTEKDVSDVYVSLGNEFNITSRAFVRIGIDVSDFDDVPGKLRTILEEALARERSQATVDVYTPAIRQIIVKLLEGLKEKQALLRTLMAQQQQQQQQVQQLPQPTFSPVTPSGDRSMVHRSATSRSPTRNDHTVPTRSATIQYPQRPADPTTPTSNPMPPPHGPQIYPGSPKRNSATYNFLPSAASPVASARPESSDFPPPVDLPPNPTTPHPSSPQAAAAVPKIIESVAASPAEYASYSHQTPTQSNDPRAQLQRSDALERRASRRFSAYQYAKLGASGPGGPTAAGAAAAAAASEFTHRSRGSSITNGSVSTPMTIQEGQVLLTNSARSSANGKVTTSERYSLQETDEEQAENEGSKTPSRTSASLGEESKMAAMAEEEEGSENDQSVTLKDPEVTEAGDAVPTADILKVPVFIQLDRKIKKVWLDADDVSLAALRLLFVERFSYSPGSENFPAMSIQDKETGVKYDLDETTIMDITSGSLIILNVDTVDETKKSLEDGMTSLLAQFAELQVKMVAQTDLIAKMTESQQTSAAKLEESIKTVVEKEMAKATALTSTAAAATPASKEVGSATAAPTARRPPITPSTSERSVKSASPKPVNQVQLAELASLRKDLAAVRQIHGGMTKTLESSLSAMKSKISESTSTQQTSIVVTGDKQVTQYHNILSTDIDSLLTKVEDLQDVIEALRKDVALRGVRPLPRQLEAVAKDLAQGRTELRRLEAYVKKEKPLWKKILERELDNIVEEQQFFTLQEDLLGDLLEDLESAAETFSLVQQFTEEQIKISAGSKRSAAPFAGGMGGFDAVSGKDAVLREVRALNPNHESRLEAIERAEKVRQLESKSRVDEFEKELGEFVEEGKLKKSGGIEEVERQRKVREEQVWKEWSENSMAMGMGML
ncbi:actin interacting protein 3-domain-containing protein [Myxozyma melibiosi]|uniref:Actin interacting protein 3-domain-containing protein n=1 Tax=Myxozyma melibiosi TaxID=54550 RepID=A0ABR1FFL8_9ASCO